MCVGPFSVMMHPRPLPGSVYRSHEIFLRLWDDIRFDNSSAIEVFLMGFFNFVFRVSFLVDFLCLVGEKMQGKENAVAQC